MTRRPRSLAVVAILVGGAIGVIAATQTWVTVALASLGGEELAASGASAAPVLAPLSLALLALGAALTIVGRVLRYAFGALTALIGVALTGLSTHIVLAQPVGSYAATVTDSTGITGSAAVADLVSSVAVSPWPYLTALAGLLVVAAGAFTLATGHRWTGSGRRFRTESAGGAPGGRSRPVDAVDSWDELSRGEDPTA